jgi:hypothetical protein
VSERLNWGLSWEATRFALIVSWPFTAYGSLLLLCVRGQPLNVWDVQEKVYFFGRPLTNIIYIFRAPGQSRTGDIWWALPLINFLFFAQWVIWTQLITLGWRVLERLCQWLDDKFPLD